VDEPLGRGRVGGLEHAGALRVGDVLDLRPQPEFVVYE